MTIKRYHMMIEVGAARSRKPDPEGPWVLWEDLEPTLARVREALEGAAVELHRLRDNTDNSGLVAEIRQALHDLAPETTEEP